MKFSYQWIKDFVPGLSASAKELEQLITVRTAECDGIQTVGALLAGARVARVLAAEPVGETHITKTTVDIGESAPITVACGASNCRAGMTTVWVPVGTKTIQGVESNGMLASANELDLSREHAGIVEWSEPAIDLAPDQIIEIDNKSLTHRPDLWGHLGMAREVAAIVKRPLVDPVDLALLPGGSDSYEIRIEDAELCPRFSLIVYENVTVRPSPYWLQYRLTSVGLNPINNIVDITNYVAAELAQPMHAFDRDKLRGDRLIVRAARDGETLAALNDEDYTLTTACGVVADAEGPVSLAGIIGGSGSKVSETTTDVVFESANWKASSIRKTSSALKIRTDASMRFEKAQDPANTVRALARTIALMKTVCPEARLVGRLTDVYSALPEPPTIRLKLDVLNRKLGRDVPAAEARNILERLAFDVDDRAPGIFAVTVPTWRATKDVSVPDDLVEEVGRMIGYDSIAPAAPLVACTVPPDNPERMWHRELRAMLAARGFTEVYNYSFLSDEQARRFQLADDSVRVLNPIASDQNLLRSSLIPGIFNNLELNSKHLASFCFFEIGREIHGRPSGLLPVEVTHLAAAIYGEHELGLFQLKRIAEAIVPNMQIKPIAETRSYEHPARTGNVILNGNVIGRLFEAHPRMLDGRAAVLDLDLDSIFADPSANRAAVSKYTPIRRFPSSAFDLSMIAPRRELAGVLEARIRDFAGPLLESIIYLREYTGPQVPEDRKSVTYRLTLGAADRTLSSDEVNAVRARIIEKMRELGHEMRE